MKSVREFRHSMVDNIVQQFKYDNWKKYSKSMVEEECVVPIIVFKGNNELSWEIL